MPATNHKLTTQQVARFVADGFLRFDALIPDSINKPVIEELRLLESNKINQIFGQPTDAAGPPQPASLTPLSQCYPPPSVLGAMLALPEVQGIIESLVGPDPLFDHDFVHRLPAGSTYHQHLHVDAVVDRTLGYIDHWNEHEVHPFNWTFRGTTDFRVRSDLGIHARPAHRLLAS